MNVNFNENIYNQPKMLANNSIRADYNHMTNTSDQTFTGLEDAAKKFAENLVKKQGTKNLLENHRFNKLLKAAVEKPNLYEAIVALAITCLARPLTILGTPGAKMEDKQYASAQSIASGLSGLFFNYAIFETITKTVDNVLIDVNGENVKTAFQNFYKNEKNKDLISQLVERKIIPNPTEFEAECAKNKNIFGYMKKYLTPKEGKGAKKLIDELLDSNDNAKIKEWIELSKKYSEALSSEFKAIKNNGVSATQKYLVHDSFEFLKEGAYKLKQSLGAGKVQYSTNLIAKMLFFPLTAYITIKAIPKIMKFIFPNHKRSKGKHHDHHAHSVHTTNVSDRVNMESFKSAKDTNIKVFEQFTKKPAMNKSSQVSFSGGLSSISSGISTAYNKFYKEPIANVVSKGLKNITYSKWYSDGIKHLISDATTTKYGLNTVVRNRYGEIVNKWDENILTSNFPNMVAVFGSCLYIINTIRNKEIDPDRKPALCMNMALVAVLSLLASGGLKRLSKPLFEELKRTHTSLMGDRLNYDNGSAWKCAQDLLTSVVAFRYVGPVLATPAADKMLRLFGKPKGHHHHEKH